MRWVKLTLPPRPRARWLLITMRLSASTFAGSARTLVAVGTVSDWSMLATMRAATPRSGTVFAPAGTVAGAAAFGLPSAAGGAGAFAGAVFAGAGGAGVAAGAGGPVARFAAGGPRGAGGGGGGGGVVCGGEKGPGPAAAGAGAPGRRGSEFAVH